MTPAQRRNVDRLLNPRQIAFVGGAQAIVAINEARRREFPGEMWAVNPKRPELAGLPCFASLEDLPGPPDAVYLAIPAAAAVECVAQLNAKGSGGVVCYSAGFKEAGAAGASLERALKQAVGDMALVGPNCYGVINYIDKAALWSFEHGGSSPGYGAAIITQSGMLSSDITMCQRSLPLAYMISAGNQAVMGLEDFLDVLCEDPKVRAIGLHIEGLQDVAGFERAALKALAHDTPIVALKTGTSAIGSSLTVSHTGSLSGTNELYEALFARTGVIGVTNPSQMLETLKYLCVAGVPSGKRIAGFTCSGGGATMLADHAERIGLSFPGFGAEDAADLADLLPAIATVSNPLDYTTPIWGLDAVTYQVFAAALARVDVDCALLVQDYPAAELDQSKIHYQKDAAAFVRAADWQGLPTAICATFPENLDASTRGALIDQGVAPMQGLHETLNAIRDAADWGEAQARILSDPPQAIGRGYPSRKAEMVLEADGKAWLIAAGIAVPDGRLVASSYAVQAAEDIGYPVAVKMMSPHLAHKTEAGAVALGLGGAGEVVQAIEEMRASVAQYDPCAVTDSFLVEALCPVPLAELIVGIRSDAQFGYALTLGSGGILVELVSDVETLLLPCTASDIGTALQRLKVGRMLTGFRGRKPVDLDAVSAALLALCQQVQRHGDSILELEINPLFVYEDSVIAVDVLLHRAADRRGAQ